MQQHTSPIGVLATLAVILSLSSFGSAQHPTYSVQPQPQRPTWKSTINPARTMVPLPHLSSIPQVAHTRFNVEWNRESLLGNVSIDAITQTQARIEQLHEEFFALGERMAASEARLEELLAPDLNSGLDIQIQQLASRVLSSNAAANIPPRQSSKASPDLLQQQVALDDRAADLVAEIERELIASDQRLYRLRHQHDVDPTVSSRSIDSSLSRLKLDLTKVELTQLGQEFSLQRKWFKMRTRIASNVLERSTKLGYLNYVKQLVDQDKLVLLNLASSDSSWIEQLRRVEALTEQIEESIAEFKKSAVRDWDETEPHRYALVRRAISSDQR